MYLNELKPLVQDDKIEKLAKEMNVLEISLRNFEKISDPLNAHLMTKNKQ